MQLRKNTLDNNWNVDVVVDPAERREIDGIVYTLYCARATQEEAEAIKDDLREMGHAAIVQQEGDNHTVWWPR